MKYDLHTHTYYSDGTASPEELIHGAVSAGLSLVALTDHDTTEGVARARAAAAESRLPFLCGAEIEAEYCAKLHILALGVDIASPGLVNMLEIQEQRRCERNGRMLKRLAEAGYDAREFYRPSIGCTTRTHIANALIEAGFAVSIADAFTRLIGRYSPYFIACEHPTMRQVVECIMEAGGKAVLAHPHKMRCDHAELVKSLADCGLWGVEVYYPGTTEENIALFSSLARAHGLNITCGSDFHGDNRPEALLGCAWRNTPELEKSYEIIKELAV